MKNYKIKVLAMSCILFVFTQLHAQKFENLAQTPPMGWNSWNKFQTEINEQLIKETADVMVSSGMRDAGYIYLVLDDGWMASARDEKTGNLVADPKKFPHGMKAIADYIHSKGLKFGIYNCAGTKTCQGLPGTRGYEYQDARLYASWDVDYLKFDWCNSDKQNAEESYTTMGKALLSAKRPMIFSICEWGTNKPWIWGAKIGHLWRTTDDIGVQFDGYIDHKTWKQLSIMTMIDQQVGLEKYAGNGHWNDPDMLEVGNGLTASENRLHFSMWCMLAAPLMSGNDLTKMSQTIKEILMNKDVIAIDQDPLGFQAFRYSNEDSVQVWFKPLQNDEWAACFLNRSSIKKNINFNWQRENVNDTLHKRSLPTATANFNMYDLWKKKNIDNTKNPLNVTLPPHDVLLIRLSR
jgi:alpha-galactosidase